MTVQAKLLTWVIRWLGRSCRILRCHVSYSLLIGISLLLAKGFVEKTTLPGFVLPINYSFVKESGS